MTVKKRRDDATPHVVMHKVADIRGGVSVKTSELGGNFLREGALLTAPDTDGICHVVKTAQVAVAVGSTEKAIKVTKFHNFKVGDVVMADGGTKAYPITAIDDSGKDVDILTVKTTLGELKANTALVEAKAESADAAAVKYEAVAVNGTGKPFDAKTNIDTDAWVIAVTHKNPVPAAVVAKMKGIINL